MDKHLGVISGLFQDLKHMLQGDTMTARMYSSGFHKHHRYHRFAQLYRQDPDHNLYHFHALSNSHKIQMGDKLKENTNIVCFRTEAQSRIAYQLKTGR